MTDATMNDPTDNSRKAARRSALWLGGFVIALYAGYIIWSIHKARGG
ncbi:MAG: hypothetical protein RLZZ200_3012 [Pseudomonadota bacterium]|jgi:hypothetical protein